MHSFSLKQRFCNLIPIFCIFCFFLIADTTCAENSTLDEGKRLIEEEEIEQAKEVLLKVVEREPENAEVNFLLSKVSVMLGDHDGGIKYGKEAVKLDESVSDYHLWLGRAHGMQAQMGSKLKAIFRAKRAKNEFEKAVELDPRSVQARLQLAQYLLMAPGIAGGDKEKAVEHAKIIQKQDSLYGAFAWGYYWQFQKDSIKAEKYFREAVGLDTTRHHEATYTLGIFLQDRERYHEAAELFDEAYQKYPEERGLLYQVGRSYIFAEDSLDKAERCFKQYLQVKSRFGTPDWAAAHWRLGMVYDLKGETDLAIAELEKAVRLDPETKQYQNTLKEVKKKRKS
jgi:tetratricopeptide (TPR) repeat protein